MECIAPRAARRARAKRPHDRRLSYMRRSWWPGSRINSQCLQPAIVIRALQPLNVRDHDIRLVQVAAVRGGATNLHRLRVWRLRENLHLKSRTRPDWSDLIRSELLGDGNTRRNHQRARRLQGNGTIMIAPDFRTYWRYDSASRSAGAREAATRAKVLVGRQLRRADARIANDVLAELRLPRQAPGKDNLCALGCGEASRASPTPRGSIAALR